MDRVVYSLYIRRQENLRCEYGRRVLKKKACTVQKVTGNTWIIFMEKETIECMMGGERGMGKDSKPDKRNGKRKNTKTCSV